MKEFGIHPYHRADAPVADLVLVHGLMGDSTGTWTGKDDKGQPTYWPDWIRERRPDVNIWLADYDSSLNAWLQPAMPLDQIGGSLLMHAKDQGLGTRPIHWVGHSMGGLIIKYLLCEAREKADPNWRRIGEVPTAITFLGTPHHGSEVAKWEQYFGPLLIVLDVASTGGVVTSTFGITQFLADRARNAKIESHMQQLRAHAKPLGNLNGAFSQWLGAAFRTGNLLRVRNYYETIPVYKAVMVVPQHSAQLSNALVEEGAAPANHFDICKFSSTGNAVFNSIIVSLNDLSGTNAPAGDLLDRAWRKALEQCSAKVRAVVCDEMKKTFEGRSVASAELEKALEEAFVRVAPLKVLTDVRYALGSPKKGFSELNSDECRQRGALYVLLMVRAVALWRQSDLRIEAAGGAIVPDADGSKQLAIAVAAHLMSGQGILLKIEPDAVRPDNLLDAAALTEAHAHPPGQPSGPSPLENEVRAWLRRILNTPHSPQATELLKAFLDRFEDDHHARPILLDREGVLVDLAVKALLEQLGIGVVGIAANDRPANIPPEDWQTLCHIFELKASDLTGQAPPKPVPPEPKVPPVHDTLAHPPQPSIPLQVNFHQTISGAVGQSNVTTGSHSPIQTQHADAAPPSAPPDAAQDALALAVFSFERTLNDHADLKNDLRELHALVLRRDASSSALSLLPRLLRPLRDTAQASPDAWERLRNAAHAHWPQSRDFF